MKSDAPVKQFDCVAYMREARERISADISSMSHEEFRRLVNASLTQDPIFVRLAGRWGKSSRHDAGGRPRSSPVTTAVEHGSEVGDRTRPSLGSRAPEDVENDR